MADERAAVTDDQLQHPPFGGCEVYHDAVRPGVRGGPERGRGWQRGHEYEERFMNGSRRIGRPQRGHGRPSWPYTASDRSK